VPQHFQTIDVFTNAISFKEKALKVFRFQYANCEVYKNYIQLLKIDVEKINAIEKIPFLPISFFKTHAVISSTQTPQVTFKSSGTTGVVQSQHFIADKRIYKKSMINCFKSEFGKIENYCFLALLPSYIEKENSSLVYMVEQMMQMSEHPDNGFYLYNHDELNQKLMELESKNQKTILIGVTYALLDFAEKYQPKLNCTTIIETGGMKGRREEWLKFQVHDYLKKSFTKNEIASEYGMTELLSQFYAIKDGVFKMQSHAKILIRDRYDPFQISDEAGVTGCINVIDLANINSCSFIATDDMGKILSNSTFEINGRADNSDLRGCNLMIDE
jgi:phenylacetate-coenzyme A ligase PaaK-like adenylate-forming protein